MDSLVKQEFSSDPGKSYPALAESRPAPALPPPLIDLTSSDSDSDADGLADGAKRLREVAIGEDGGEVKKKKAKVVPAVEDLPLGFLDPLTPEEELPLPEPQRTPRLNAVTSKGSRQFWKAGDDFLENQREPDSTPVTAGGMDHVRVHPKFLHSNATSHKWALGALAELLDNSLDEVCNGATFVNIDMLENNKDGSRMLLVEDDGGGMDPDKMRQCMSLGYSAKCKTANTIGQYGNGFKTSTMRLGADVIVFSRCRGKGGRRPTQSIGMLSYTFLRDTGKEDILVPMLDYEKGQVWNKMSRSSSIDWNANLETIVQWSPYSSEADLLQQFSSMRDQGTRIVIYNLWEDDQGGLELDFDTDKHDIQIRGVNRDERKIEMAKQFPNSKHFLTFRHSLRSYASILYLRLSHIFKMILRGKLIAHHNLVNDMMMKQEVTYRPQPGPDGVPKDPNLAAVVTIGFVKDAKYHIDIQGFNVYHKNRLIKPFWRVWNAAGSDGRGVIGVLEANFVEPAHDKQDFERTTILSRLEARLILMQKAYWSTNCHKIGYAPRRNKKFIEDKDKESSPQSPPRPLPLQFGKVTSPKTTVYANKAKDSIKGQSKDKSFSISNSKMGKVGTSPIASVKSGNQTNGNSYSLRSTKARSGMEVGKVARYSSARLHETSEASNESDPEIEGTISERLGNDSAGPRISAIQRTYDNGSFLPLSTSSIKGGTRGNYNTTGAVGITQLATRSQSEAVAVNSNGDGPRLEESDSSIKHFEEENERLNERIRKMEEELQYEKSKNKSLTEQLEAAQNKLEEATKEQDALCEIFSEERCRRDKDEENLRKKLKDASLTIKDLVEKLSATRNGS